MSYDHWKTTDPDDMFLESAPQSDEDDDREPLDYHEWELLSEAEADARARQPDESSAQAQDWERNQPLDDDIPF
jgi:hypothetical protein